MFLLASMGESHSGRTAAFLQIRIAGAIFLFKGKFLIEMLLAELLFNLKSQRLKENYLQQPGPINQNNPTEVKHDSGCQGRSVALTTGQLFHKAVAVR